VSTRATSLRRGTAGEECRDVLVRLLNAFELRVNGEPIDLPLSGRRLLAFLALRGRALQRVHVAGTLWINMSEERAFANLRSTLWRVNHRGYRVVDADGSRLSLAGNVRVDLNDAKDQARRLVNGGGEEIPVFDNLAFAGEILPDWYDDWVLIERERFRQLVLHGLEALGERLLRLGRYGEAADVALAAVASEPLRESAHRLLIRIHIAEKNPSEAVREYRLYRGLLGDQLGLEPSSTLRELVRDFDAAATAE
jgi:DNA-binding SARP family transcriptional activator